VPQGRDDIDPSGRDLRDEDEFASHSPMPAAIGPYHLIARLGGGSMADLYVAQKLSPFGVVRRAVIKRVKRSRTDYKLLEQMLLDEARATACFDHPNLVSILDIGEDDNGMYLALEFVDGTDLRRVNAKLRQRREALPFELAVLTVAEVLRGLHHAHCARGPDGKPLEIVHRDVNPANVLVSTTGHVKLADFGVVRMRDRIQQQTEPGLVKGKYAYLAPEYIAGEPCSVQTDIYAAGIMLFELLSGRECFTGKTAYEVMWKIVNQGVPMYRLEREGVSEDLRRVVERATSTAPERRYAAAQDMANALEAWLMRSGKHATPWVLSVFFTRHRLYPETSELKSTTLSLASAASAIDKANRLLPPPRVPPERLDSAQVVAHQLAPATAAREIDNSQLTPMPEIEAMPFEMELPILAPDLDDAPTDSASPMKVPSKKTPPRGIERTEQPAPTPPVSFNPAALPTPPPLSADPVLEIEVSDPTPTPNVVRTPSGEIEVAAKQAKDTAWVEFSQKRPGPDPHATPTIPAMQAPVALRQTEEAKPPEPRPPPVAPSVADAPKHADSGKLEDTPAVEVLSRITGAALSGTLEFRCGLIWKRVQISHGSPMGITSNMGMELIGEHLVKARLISRRDLDHALAAAERTGTLLTVKLLELGLLSREILEEELGKNLGARLAEVLEWRWGTFEFREETVPSSDLLPRLDLQALLAKARAALEKRSEDEEKKEPSGEHSTQKKLKEALKVARSIATSSGKGRRDHIDPDKR
jgi:serine/threonine-protein kinase